MQDEHFIWFKPMEIIEIHKVEPDFDNQPLVRVEIDALPTPLKIKITINSPDDREFIEDSKFHAQRVLPFILDRLKELQVDLQIMEFFELEEMAKLIGKEKTGLKSLIVAQNIEDTPCLDADLIDTMRGKQEEPTGRRNILRIVELEPLQKTEEEDGHVETE